MLYTELLIHDSVWSMCEFSNHLKGRWFRVMCSAGGFECVCNVGGIVVMVPQVKFMNSKNIYKKHKLSRIK